MKRLLASDDDTFIVESFRPENVDLRVSLDRRYAGLRDLLTGEEISSKAGGGIRTIFPVSLKPHSFRVFTAMQAH